jgi:hypothetical protein
MKAATTQHPVPVVGNTIIRLAFVSGSLLACMFVIVKIFSSALELIS